MVDSMLKLRRPVGRLNLNMELHITAGQNPDIATQKEDDDRRVWRRLDVPAQVEVGRVLVQRVAGTGQVAVIVRQSCVGSMAGGQHWNTNTLSPGPRHTIAQSHNI